MKIKLNEVLKKMFSRFIQTSNQSKEWKQNEYFDESWRDRIHLMSKFIPDGSIVMDLGCGKMWLKEMISTSGYIPVDYCDRGFGTQLCDFNNKEFPNKTVDYSFVSGCLEYVVDPKWFISEIAKASSACIISYCTTDNVADIGTRKKFCWVNNLSRSDIIELFQEGNMFLRHETLYLSSNSIFVFCKE